MPRTGRAETGGLCCHVLNRGNGREVHYLYTDPGDQSGLSDAISRVAAIAAASQKQKPEVVGPVGDWSECLTQPEDDRVLARLRRWTLRGCPLGSDSFVSKLDRTVGRRLRPLPIGRPRKTKKKRPKKI